MDFTLPSTNSINISKAVWAYHEGLVSPSYPHYEELQTVCYLLDSLDRLYDLEHELTYERCPNTGVYVENEEAMQNLTREIHRIQKEVDNAETILEAALLK